MKNYKKSDFYYELPEAQIARYPLDRRSDARLLCVDFQEDNALLLQDSHVYQFEHYLKDSDLLVFNNTKVLPARFFAMKPTGGKVEVLIERMRDVDIASAYLKASKAPKIGDKILLGDYELQVLAREASLFILKSNAPLAKILKDYGEMPIPPYLNRQAMVLDKERYQTVYAKYEGAVAAPTAGLHFDEALLSRLKSRGITFAEVTLHVGAGTFQNVREEDLKAHIMHKEWIEVRQEVVEAVEDCRLRGGRVIAIGTTSLRALESAAFDGILKTYEGDTQLFIYPPYDFKVVDALFTNFHLPESTLLMLVSAFAGYKETQSIYQHAIKENYRFYSYGDAMFIAQRNTNS